MYTTLKDHYAFVMFNPANFPADMRSNVIKQNQNTLQNIRDAKTKHNNSSYSSYSAMSNQGTGTYINDKSPGNWHQAYYDNDGFTMNSRYW